MSIPAHEVTVGVDEALIPNEYLCPITIEVMREPVVLADGFSYERAAIETWLNLGHRTSPKTGARLSHRAVMPNITLKIAINEHMENLPKLQAERIQQKMNEATLLEHIKSQEAKIQALINENEKKLAEEARRRIVDQLNKKPLPENTNINTLLNARSIQRNNLKEAYEREFANLKRLAEEAKLKLETIITPMQEECDFLDNQAEIISLQLEYLTRYESAQLLAEELKHLTETYDQKVSLLINFFILDYRNLVNEREAIYRNGTIIAIATRDEKEREIKRYADMLYSKGKPIFLNWTLADNPDKIKEAILLKNQEREAIQQRYEAIKTQQTEAIDRYYALENRLEAPSTALQQQSKVTLINLSEHHPIYKLCRNGSLAELKQRLPQKDPLEYLMQHAPDALHQACGATQLDIVKFLIGTLRFPYSPDQEGYYPIHRAVQYDHPNKIALLDYLEGQGADLESQGIYGRRPLHTACLYGCESAVSWLLLRNVEMNCHEKGRFQANTPLHNAAYAGKTVIVEMLLQKAANPRLLNKSDQTPLMEAIFQKHYQVAEVFFTAGIWLSAEDYKKLLAFSFDADTLRCLELPLRKALESTQNLKPVSLIEMQQATINNRASSFSETKEEKEKDEVTQQKTLVFSQNNQTRTNSSSSSPTQKEQAQTFSALMGSLSPEEQALNLPPDQMIRNAEQAGIRRQTPRS